MKRELISFSIFLLGFYVFCTPPPREPIHGTYDPKTLFWLPDTYDFEKDKTFNYPFDDVWSALVDILREADMPITSSDKASGVITLHEWVTADTVIETRYCDCGRHSFRIHTYRGWERRPFEQIDDPRIANTTFYVRSIDSLHTEVKVVNNFHISYRTPTGLLEKPAKDWITALTESTYPPVWRCTSTGRLESWFFHTLESKLLVPSRK
jgi:hypothetical protein